MNNGGDDDDGVDLSSVAIRYLITDLHMIIIMVIMMMMMKIMTMIMIMMMTMTVTMTHKKRILHCCL